jgi:alkylation response protein AidB-like acyl-CoA dehydrogenase
VPDYGNRARQALHLDWKGLEVSGIPTPLLDWSDWNPSDPGITSLQAILPDLGQLDGPADEAGVWSEDLWTTLVRADAHRWVLGCEHGGLALDAASVIRRYGRLAEESLTAVFLLTQHDAAVRRLMPSREKPNVSALLGKVASGATFITVGISQLTTSTRLGTAAVRAALESDGGVVLDGVMPWVTGAVRAEAFVTGGVLDDGRQVLVVVPRDRAGLSVEPPLPLAALQASCTCEVRCEGVRAEPEEILAGPSDQVMKLPGLAGTGGLETSALALGQARAAIAALAEIAADRGDTEPVAVLAGTWQRLAADLVHAVTVSEPAPPPGEIRRQANALVLRATQGYLTARKGAGFLRTDRAQRWARQALFFLVWSCPTPVAQASIRELAGLCPS